MRVLHVIPTVAPRYGGTTTAIVGMVAALNRRSDVTAEVVATDADGPGRYSAENWPVANSRIHLFPSVDAGKRSLRSPELNAWLMEHAGEFDVCHIHTVWNDPVFMARKAATLRRRPIVLSPHGMLSDYTWSRNRLLKGVYWLLRERGNLAAAASVHCTSEGEAAEVRRYRSRTGSVDVIPIGIETAALDTPIDREVLRRMCGERTGVRPIVLFLSRLHPKKGLTDFLLPAFARLTTPAFLAIVGGPDGNAVGYEQEVRRTVERLGLADRVAHLGPVPPEKRWAMFDGADLFVLPSRQENFGLVVTEAMARGCAAVISKQTFACEHLLAAGAGRVIPLGVESVAKAIDEMLTDTALRRDMGRQGRKYARDCLSWDRVAAQFVAIYQRN
jgi:glycosyltransferase involved in cell wall biosynthesis